MPRNEDVAASSRTKRLGEYSFEDYVELARRFHGYAAPGLLVGGFMVEEAKSRIPKGVLFDAIVETSWCLPDAVQMLTPCTIGNGWMKIVNMGVYAVSLYDKYVGEGVRVYLDVAKLDQWSEIKAWYLKLRPKREQDSDLLREQMGEAGSDICSVERVLVHEKFLGKRSKGKLGVCPVCGEAYPLKYGGICRSCQGEAPYARRGGNGPGNAAGFGRGDMGATPVEQAVGGKLLHDMTKIVQGKSKGAEFKAGQTVTAGDVCRLQQMGRNLIYLDVDDQEHPDWVHENDAASAFGRSMAGEGVRVEEEIREGKANLTAERDGLLVSDVEALERFNMLPGVMCAGRQSYSVVTAGTRVAGTRAIPLYLERRMYEAALSLLDGPIFEVRPMRRAKVGILVTGTEIFSGLIEDKFGDVISRKVKGYDCEVVDKIIAPDETQAVKRGVEELIARGADLIVTTAGLSVDPEDVTRQGLIEAGAEDMLYGAPILPGAMTLLARIGELRIIGVPACALFFKTTSFDLLLPRLLAGVEIRRADLARMSHGGLCHECKNCTFPKCNFGR